MKTSVECQENCGARFRRAGKKRGVEREVEAHIQDVARLAAKSDQYIYLVSHRCQEHSAGPCLGSPFRGGPRLASLKQDFSTLVMQTSAQNWRAAQGGRDP